jgi:DNA-binding NarL/FixJ family response regulator
MTASRSAPYIVTTRASGLADTAAELRAAGWGVVSGFHPPPGAGRVVCVGRVESVADASAALLAALAGHGIVFEARADRDLVDRLCDDLRRLGRLEHRDGGDAHPSLPAEEHALLERLLSGQTLGQAAVDLHLSRRTADRRLASARRSLGADSTAQALTTFSRLKRGVTTPCRRVPPP